VGVMITFAAIAAAGDVNVNTIAPGVAAAMTATVVGLLVAIPSLFGYNWLATRVSRRTSAMEVFADQFVSSLALLALAARDRPEPVEDASRRSGYAT
jgi:biopolymer transport protein ExbB